MQELADLKFRLRDAGTLEETNRLLDQIEEKRHILKRVESLHESNPMLGLRGVRLAIHIPELTAMQVRAIIEAACIVTKEGVEADGNNSLRLSFLQGGNRGEPGDAWGVSGPGRITSSTTPSTRLNSGEASGVTIYDISISGGLAHVTLSSRTVPDASLLQEFLGDLSTPLTPQERTHLDMHGNQNGQYDVGDLRAYLKR